MTTAYWCVLIAAIIPMLMSTLAKAGGKGFDNAAVRNYLEPRPAGGSAPTGPSRTAMKPSRRLLPP